MYFITDQEALAGYQAWVASGCDYRAAGKAMGKTDNYVRRRVRAATDRALIANAKPVEYPAFVDDGDEEEPIDELLSRLQKGFERKHRQATARRWFTVKVKEEKPYGLLMFGDPHLGDNGCNMPLLMRHLEIAKRPGIYGLNIGDTTNNWVGRLMRLYAEQETSAKTEKRLAEWFMFDAGVKWLCWILGNHDDWNGGADFQKRLGGQHIPIIDWKAQFKIALSPSPLSLSWSSQSPAGSHFDRNEKSCSDRYPSAVLTTHSPRYAGMETRSFRVTHTARLPFLTTDAFPPIHSAAAYRSEGRERRIASTRTGRGLNICTAISVSYRVRGRSDGAIFAVANHVHVAVNICAVEATLRPVIEAIIADTIPKSAHILH